MTMISKREQMIEDMRKDGFLSKLDEPNQH